MNPAYPNRITINLLKKHGACEEQVAIFKEMFPNGTKVTVEAIQKAAEAGLDLEWCVDRFVEGNEWKELCALIDEHVNLSIEKKDAAENAHHQAMNELLLVYYETISRDGPDAIPTAQAARTAAEKEAEDARMASLAEATRTCSIAIAPHIIKCLGLS